MKQKICLIDGSGYIFRAFFASPMMTNPEGTPVNAVYGFLNMFLSLTTNIDCDYCLVLFDAKRQNFRNEIFSQYKATRPELPAELKPQFALIHEVVEALNLHWLQMEGYEADDLIATYADLALKNDMDAVIVSADKDLMQLIRPGVTFYDSMKNKYFTPEDVKEKFGVYPEHVIDVQALAGDSTDNIPGIPGIGLKTAAELVNTFGSLQGVLDHASEIKQNKRRELVLEHKEDALISLKLVTLKPDVPVEIPLNNLKCTAPNEAKLLDFLDKHAFKSLKNKSINWLKQRCASLPLEEQSKKEPTATYTTIQNLKDLDELKNEIIKENAFSFKAYGDSSDLYGLSVGLKNGIAFYLPLAHTEPATDLFSTPIATDGITKEQLQHFLEPLLLNQEILKISINIKEQIHILKHIFSKPLSATPYEDISILSYDLNSLQIAPTLSAMSLEFLNKELRSATPDYKKISLNNIPVKEATTLCAEEADYIYRLYEIFRAQLLPEKKLYVYEGIDRPLVETLYKMEQTGIMLDTIKLKQLNEDFNKELSNIQNQIYTLAGEEFNLGSPKQIGEILYNKLGLKGKKHSSGSLNTSAEVLEQMAETHELPQKILDWRQYQKLQSTYTSALLTLMDKDNRVHTTYNQVSVNTGRLSSSNPNLQNIPIRTPIGRKIRECFIASPNHKLIAADYSQVELRLLATIADVKFLQEAFKENVDIHRKTASQVFNIPYEEVDALHRRRAKAINFGIIYGMSAYGLAKEIDVSPADAQKYIDAYFSQMPEIKTYMEQTINFARQNGYVLTPFNRKITIPNIQSDNKRFASFAERAAINAPIQGGAADIIKMAMNRISSILEKEYPETKMLLQVHDELVLETPTGDIEKIASLIKSEMENITGITLKVPLIAEVGIGDNWGDAH